MARKEINPDYLKEFSRRFNKLIADELRTSNAELCRRLEYGNHSTISLVRNGSCLLTPEKLRLLSEIETPDGRIPNLHWLLTGDGPIMLKKYRTDESRQELNDLLDQLSKEQIDALGVLFQKNILK